MLVAIGANGNGFSSPQLADLAQRADAIKTGNGLDELAAAYPPIPTLLTAAIPGGVTSMSVVSAVFGGIALQLLIARLVRREIHPAIIASLVLGLVTAPAVWFQATQDPAPFMALMLLVISIDGFVRFIVRNDTAGGFASGLALAGAFFCDPIALVYAIAITCCAPFLTRHRGFGSREYATMMVLLFPTASMMLSWAFLEWRFTGAAFAGVWRDTDVLRFGVSIDTALNDAATALLLTPVFLVTIALVCRRRPRAAATMAIPVAGIALTSWLGLEFSEASAFVLLTVVALYSIPRQRRLLENLALGAAGLGQLLLSTLLDIDAERIEPFLTALF